MTYSLFKSFILSLAIFFSAGCQKEAIQLNDKRSEELTASKGPASGGCRMTMYDYYNSFNDYHQIDNITYKNGLADEWTLFGWTYKMEYDKNHQLKISRIFVEGELVYTIQLIYKNNKMIKEVWYIGNTTDIDDEIFYTYNKNGNLLRNESFLYDFFVDYTYFSNGSLKSWEYYDGGLPVIKGEYTYKGAHKNPFLAIPGLDYTITYLNAGFGIGTGKKWYTSEKITLFDANGDPFIDYEQDPSQTTWQVGQQNYPLNVDYIDIWGEGLIRNTFEYENCNPVGELGTAQNKPINKNKDVAFSKHFKSILHGPSKSSIEKLKTKHLNKKNIN